MFEFLRPGYTRDKFNKAISTILGNCEGGAEQQELALMGSGFGVWEARLLVVLIPEAFATPILEDFGVIVGTTVSALDVNGNWLEANLDKQPAYVAGLKFAREHRRSPVISDDAYMKIAHQSSMYDALRNALTKGIDIEGGVLAVALNETGIAHHLKGPLTRSLD